MQTRLRRMRQERGAALLEMALTLPLLLLVCVGILEFGRAYQTWQVMTNAAREGARIAVLPGTTNTDVTNRVQTYLTNGQLPNAASATVNIDRTQTISIGTSTAPAAQVTVNYPFDFIVLDPIARLATGQGSATPSTLNMVAQALMRTE
ncbi:MAG TPA: TadE/TadG family type IV pilus assembly protein [Vicinamibacterales bacterium]|nr:TadE/TadG family type IV pilus assembly protein [Vicinamibacterales bacterium]